MNQSYQQWECLIIDDGSTDNSESVINQFIIKDNRFHFYKRRNEEKGAPSCRNIGIEKAKGKYIVFLDSDDLLAPYALQNRSDAAAENKTLDFLVFKQLTFNQKVGDNHLLWAKTIDGKEALFYFLKLNSAWPISGPLWKKEFLDRNRILWNPKVKTWQDCEFSIKCLLKSLNFKWIVNQLPDGFIRMHTGNRISQAASIEYAIKRTEAYNTILNKIEDEELKSIYRASVRSYIVSVLDRHILMLKEKLDFKEVMKLLNAFELTSTHKKYLSFYARIILYYKRPLRGIFYNLTQKLYPKYQCNTDHKKVSSETLNKIESLLINR